MGLSVHLLLREECGRDISGVQNFQRFNRNLCMKLSIILEPFVVSKLASMRLMWEILFKAIEAEYLRL